MLKQKKQQNKLPKLIIIVGPTASGKTALSLKLAKKFKGEIVSADSRAIYQELDIGSAKPLSDPHPPYKGAPCRAKRCGIILPKMDLPSAKKSKTNSGYLVNGIPHHLIDIARPNQVLTLAQYKKMAVQVIKEITTRGHLPFLVGGTALYIYAVADNWLIPKVPPDAPLRARLEKQPTEKLWTRLIKKDPAAQDFINPQNKRRIIRALEVIAATHHRFSQQRRKGSSLFNILWLGTERTDREIKKLIAKRTQVMLRTGLVKEVKKLLKKGYRPSSPALSGIGYKEIIGYLQGPLTLKEAIALINKNDEQLVRRQKQWFKKDKRIKWIKNSREAFSLVNAFGQN